MIVDTSRPRETCRLTLAEMAASASTFHESRDSVRAKSAESSTSGNLRATRQETSTHHVSSKEIQRNLRAATKPRRSRKRLNVPPRITAANYRARRGRQSRNAWHALRSYFDALVFRMLNDREQAGHARLTLDDARVLADALDAYARDYLSGWLLPFDPYARPSRFERFAYVDEVALDRLCRAVAMSQITDWSPDWIRQRRAWGRKGGRPPGQPSRAAASDPAKLDALAALIAAEPRLTGPQLAERLGVSPSTVDRMRQALRERRDTHS